RFLNATGPNVLINSGAIGGGAELQEGGTVTNSGSIAGQLSILGKFATVTNSGRIAGGAFLDLGQPFVPGVNGTIINSGQITGGAQFVFENGILNNSGTIVGTGQISTVPRSDRFSGAGVDVR